MDAADATIGNEDGFGGDAFADARVSDAGSVDDDPGAAPDATTDAHDAGPGDAACAVSWSSDLFPHFKPAGEWKCADSNCHGPGASPPLIDGTSAHAAYDQLVAYHLATSPHLPYFAPGATLLDASAFACNTAQPATCGTLPMPSTANPPGASAPTVEETAQIAEWISCGAPEN